MPSLDELRAAAATEAAAVGAGFVGSEHLFLAWLATATSAAAEACAAAGLTATAVRAQLGAVRESARSVGGGPGNLSSHAERVLTQATEIAATAGRSAADADDAFVAMIREPRGAIARALAAAKLKPSRLRALARPGEVPVAPGAARREPPSRPAGATREKPARPRREPETDDIPESRPPERPRLTPPPRPAPPPTARRRWSWLWLLYGGVPVSIWLHAGGGEPTAVFASACVAIIPLAALISTATEQIAVRTGPMPGALLNATFGNATEVIVAIAALNAGYLELVKASLTGSILSNLLLILGLALFAGGLRQPTLKFSQTAAGMSAAMLALAVAGLILPSILRSTVTAASVMQLSEVVAAVLALTYLGSLLFTLRTHRRLFAGGDQGLLAGRPWPLGVAVIALAVATGVVAVESEFLVDTIEPVMRSLHLSQLFIGLVVIPVVGNAAEHATAVVAARRGKTELAVQIAVGSSTQVALLVAPALVLAGIVLGREMNLVFTTFEVVALGLATIVSAIVTLDGESHWFEGMQLLALYLMIGAAAWFI